MTRKEAIEAGSKHYDGKPCKRCGSTIKFVSGFSCVQCVTERTKTRSPDVFRKYIKSDKGQKWIKEYRKDPVYRAIQNRWSVAKGFHREQMARRRRQIQHDLGVLTEQEWLQIKAIYAEAASRSSEGTMYHVDHIIPLWEGGRHHPDNLQVITAEFHYEKCAEENKRRQN